MIPYSFENTMPMAITSSHHKKNHVQLPVSRSVLWTFDVDHVTMVESRVVLLTGARNYCSELRNLRQPSTLVHSP